MADPEELPSEQDSFAVRGSNQSGLRAFNERLTLSLLRNRGPMSKSEVARVTGLSAQTVSVIMRKLEVEGFLSRGQPVRGKIGQPSIPMQLAPDGALFFGLKVGRRSADLVVVDFLGSVIGSISRTHSFPSPDETLDFVVEAVATLSESLLPGQRERIAGLGVAIPGQLWGWPMSDGDREQSVSAWKDFDLGAALRAKFEIPIFIENDATCACGAELVFGDQRRARSFLHFFVGYFIGGGVVLDNALFRGATGNAGSLGTLKVPDQNGGMSQLMDVASLSLIEEALIDTGEDPLVLWQDPESWSIDPDILDRWIDGAAETLCHATKAALAIIDFEMIIIDGWLPADVRFRLVEQVRAGMTASDLTGLNDPAIREGSIGPAARPMGAASLPLSRRFLVGNSALQTTD